MVATVRRRREELDTELVAISQRLSAATRALAAAEVRRAEADRGVDIARSQVSVAESVYVEQRPILSDLCSKARVEGGVPRTLDSQAASELAALASAAKAERTAIAGSLADTQRLRTEIDGLQRDHDALARTIESTIRSVDGRRSELHAAQLKAKEHTILEAALAESLGSIDREIAPFLAAAELTRLRQLSSNVSISY